MNNTCACGVKSSTPGFQPDGGGANPTHALHFSAEQEKDEQDEVRRFVCRNHYSKKCPPAKFYFSSRDENRLVGACVFNAPQLPKIKAAYSVDLELTRLVLLDECPKNSESRFIGWCLRWLKKNSNFKAVVSYADPRFGHMGIVYRAANFKYFGHEAGHGTRRITVDGVEYHPKSAYDKWGCSGARLKEILAPTSVVVTVMPPKHVYLYLLK